MFSKKELKIIVLLILSLLGCKKEENKPDKFDVTFTIKINDIDSLTTVVVDTWTYFPVEKVTEWIGSGKFKSDYYLYYNAAFYLNRNDSIFIRTKNQGYYGCTRNLFIRLRFNEDKQLVTVRDYNFKVDTLTNELDSKFLFEWPTDSDKYSFTQHSYKN